MSVKRHFLAVVLAAGALTVLPAGTSATTEERPVPFEQCSTETARGLHLALPQPAQSIAMASQPYAVAVGEDWAFVTEPAGFVAALRLRAGTVQLVRTVPVPGEPFGATVTDEGRVLLVANYLGGLETLSTAALESGSGPVLLAQVPSRGRGDDEVVVDGSYAFVPEEVSGDVAVYDLGQFLRATGLPRAPHEVGSIPIGPSPSGVALDLPAGRLYVISQAGATVEGYGELTAVDIAEAESHPGRAVLGAVAAGCDPVRVALSGGGTVAWVTDRGADTLLASGSRNGPRQPWATSSQPSESALTPWTSPWSTTARSSL